MQAAAPAQPVSVASQGDHMLHDGTPIRLRLRQNLSSGEAKTGDEVAFEVIDEVDVDGVVVLPHGATAVGVVTLAESKKSMARGGKLNISINFARLKDNEQVALRAVKESKGGGHTGAMTGGIVAASLIIWPAAPFMLFIKGKDVVIPQGTQITGFIDGDMPLDMARFGVAPPPTPAQIAATAAASQATLVIESTPTGADIQVDGAFMGSTPSTVTVTAGMHSISVKKRGYEEWNRTLNAQGANVHMSAELERARR
jgi:hypothetical protein